jgi:uncharacterized protein (TIGR02118 family)
MIKLVCLIWRPDQMARDQFIEWWLQQHSQVAARLPGLRRYVISIAQPRSDEVLPFDGLAELWFDDEASMETAFSSLEGQAVAREDRELIGRRVAVITTENEIL